jgi:dCTP deaminase
VIVPAQKLRRIRPVEPFVEKTIVNGMSYGLSSAGYDVRIAESVYFYEGAKFGLASTIEKFDMPNDVIGMVHDKSSWARRGLSLFNTVIEPGWRGFLTLELVYHGKENIHIVAGSPIAQIVFMRLMEPTHMPYEGKYQDQKAGPQEWIKEESNG